MTSLWPRLNFTSQAWILPESLMGISSIYPGLIDELEAITILQVMFPLIGTQWQAFL